MSKFNLPWDERCARSDPLGETDPGTESAADPCGVVDELTPDSLAAAAAAAAAAAKAANPGGRDPSPWWLWWGWIGEACGLMLSLLLPCGWGRFGLLAAAGGVGWVGGREWDTVGGVSPGPDELQWWWWSGVPHGKGYGGAGTPPPVAAAETAE